MKKLFSLTLMFLLALCAVQSAFAMTIDLWSGFPDTQGQNNFWAYAYNPNTNSYRPLTDSGAYSFSTPGQGCLVPLLYRDNNSPWIVMHPASYPGGQGVIYSTEYAVLAYRATGASLFDLDVQFQSVISPLVNVFIKKNNSLLWSVNLSGSNGAAFNVANIDMNANDFLYFGVSPAGTDYYDTTILKGTMNVSPIPEPGTLMLLGTGLVGLLGFKRSFKS